ncbi:MAG TPA: PAS domain-containing protein [Bradyrhizobium sp.]|nr:PAS domain-containing protein [Bradyrhizobium sp.]
MPRSVPVWQLRPRVLFNYAIAIMAVAAALAVGLLFEHFLQSSPHVSLFLCAILFIAWACGTGPAIFATVLAIVAFEYFILEPAHSFAVSDKDVPRLAVFSVAAFFVVALSGAQRRSAESLRHARDANLAIVEELRRVNEMLRIENAERRQAEEKASRAERQLQETIDTIPTLISSYSPDGKRSFINAAWQHFTGLSKADVLGKESSTIVHPDDIEFGERQWRDALAKGEALQIEQRIRRADGEYRWHFVERVPLRDEKGNLLKWYASSYDIDDRKQAESALQLSRAQLVNAERELRLTLDSIPTFAWRTRPDGFAEYLNKRWLDYTGLSLEQAAGWEWQAVIHPDDLAQLLSDWQEILASGKSAEVEARMRRFDGEYRWFLFRPAPLYDESGKVVTWYGTNTDIEDRKQAESALQRSEAYLAEAQKLSRTGSFGWKMATGEIYWSEETYNIMRYEPTVNPSGDIIMERVHPDDRAFVRGQFYRALHGEKDLNYEHRLLMPDGEVKYLHILSHVVKDASGADEMIGALMDITQTRKAEQALHTAQAELAHASRVATLGEISASIAHEVNQPLAAIVANGQACLRFLDHESPDLNDVRGALEWIVKDGNRAADVIQRVRTLVKKTDTQRAVLDVNEAIYDIASLLQHELAAQRVSLHLELAPVLPAVFADRVQLQQVVMNLIMNGIEAMQAVVDRPRTLGIRSWQDEAREVVVAVTDSGIGLTAESQDHLFRAFFSTKPGGLGMGLSICRSIVEVHGGRLWASANAGHGATFEFALPLAEAAA